MTVTDEAVDLAMAAMPDRHLGFGRWKPALVRAQVYRMLEAAKPAMCTGENGQIRRRLGGAVEPVQRLRHAYEQVDDHPDVLQAFRPDRRPAADSLMRPAGSGLT